VGPGVLGPEDRVVRLRLAAVTEPQRELAADRELVGQRPVQQTAEPLDHLGVQLAPWRHLDDHPLDQLDAIVLAEDAGIDHPLVV
jgi:TorA maturation chaperone TorD